MYYTTCGYVLVASAVWNKAKCRSLEGPLSCVTISRSPHSKACDHRRWSRPWAHLTHLILLHSLSLCTYVPNILNMMGPGWALRIQRNRSQSPPAPVIRLVSSEGRQNVSSDELRPLAVGDGGSPFKGTNPVRGRELGTSCKCVTCVEFLILTDSVWVWISNSQHLKSSTLKGNKRNLCRKEGVLIPWEKRNIICQSKMDMKAQRCESIYQGANSPKN